MYNVIRLKLCNKVLSCTLSLSETSEIVRQQIAGFEDLHLILRRLGVLCTVYCNSVALVYGLFNNLSMVDIIIIDSI